MAPPPLGAQSDPTKWIMPGWKVERKYSNNVLIGNWYEESCKKPQAADPSSEGGTAKSSKDVQEFMADTVLRRKKQPRNANPGLSQAVLFGHTDTDPSTNLLTWYDGDFSRRGERPEHGRLPELRSWDSKSMSWQPEKSDHPVQSTPTNWGLARRRQDYWQQHHRDGLDHGLGARKVVTTYSTHFWPKQPDESAVRYGVPRDLITTLREYSRMIYRDGDVRNVPISCSSFGPTGTANASQ